MKKHLDLKVILAGIFIVALVLRLIAAVEYSNKHKILTPCDQRAYDAIAVSLLDGKGYIDAETGLAGSSRRAPIYPLFLTAIYWIFGHNYFIVRVIQSIMSALLCVLIFYIGAVTFNRKIGTLAAFMLSFYIPNILGWDYTGPNLLMTENVATLLLAALTFFTMKRLFINFSFRNSVLAGILIGLVMLTKPFFSLLPIFFFLAVLHKEKYLIIPAVKKAFFVAIGIIIIVSPWTVRNYFVHKAFVPITTQSGEGLMAGNNPYVYGGPICRYEIVFGEEGMAEIWKMPEIERDRFWRNYAKEYLLKNYKKIPKLMFKKLLCLWDVFTYDYSRPMDKARVYDSWYAIVLTFGLFGIGMSLRRKGLDLNILLLLALFATASFSAMIFAGDPRWRYPVEPYLIIFASVGIFAIYDAFKNKLLPWIIISGLVGINFLIYLNSYLVLNWVQSFMRGCGLK